MRETSSSFRESPEITTRASPVAEVFQSILGPTWARTYCFAIGMAILLCFTGANGTSAFALPTRIAYWLLLMVSGTFVAQSIGYFIERWAIFNVWQEVAVMIVAISPPITVLAWLVTSTFAGRALDWRTLVLFLPPVVIISSAMSILHSQINRVPAQSHAYRQTEKIREPGHAFRERLSLKYRHADIYALASEDHYLRVRTSVGDTLILMRLYDAIRELDGIEGSQTHRSWWVAKDGISEVVRGDGRVALRLKDKSSVPVSRSYIKALKQNGWV